LPEAPVDISDRTPIHFFCAPPSCRLIVPESIYIIQSQDWALFPSYAPHMVFPRAGNAPRIPISFNLGNEPYPRRAQVVTEHMTYSASQACAAHVRVPMVVWCNVHGPDRPGILK
jgi:hypothetical protein